MINVEGFAKLVHPECLWDLLEGDSVKVTECEPNLGKVSRDGDVVDFEPEGIEMGDGGGYEILGFVSGNAVVSTSYSTGGSGHFTTLGLFELKGGVLTLKKQISRGDRCHGGILVASLEKDQLSYEIRITPHALVALGGFGELDIDNGYPDLWDSASTCIGTVTKTLSIRSGTTTLEDVDVAPDQDEDCYSKVLNEHAAGWFETSQSLVALFAADYAKRCQR